VEVLDILLPTFDAPDWVFRAVLAGAFLGFPVTVILAWVFDISGHGVVVTETRGIRIPTWVKGLVAVPLLGLVGVMGWWVWSGYVEERETSLRPTELGDTVPIVAVRAIRNVTGDPDLDWYSEGLANLVRDNLSQSRFLRVVSPPKWSAITAGATDENEIATRAEEEGIGFILSGEMLMTPEGITVSSRLTDTAGGVQLSSRQVQGLTSETLLTASGPLATQVKQGLNVPRAEQVDIFAADFATSNLSAYESYIAGLQFFLKFEYEKAEQAFRAALELAPDFAIARYRMAYIQAVTGRTEQAISNMERALEAEPLADRERQYIEAALALFQRDYDLAAQKFEALLETYPFEIEAREMLAQAYWGQYRHEEAIREMELLAAEEPQNQVIWSWLGWYRLAMGDFEGAQPALERFAQLAPEDANSHVLLGDSLRYQGDFQAARAKYLHALEIDDDMPEVAHSLATIEFLEGRFEVAEARFRDIAESESLSIRWRLDALFPLVSLLAAQGNFQEAVALLQAFNEMLEEEQIRLAMATSMEALFQLEMGHIAAARELAESAIGLSPGVPTRYLFARGLIELRAEEFDQLEATAEEISSHALPADNPDRTEEMAAAYLRGMAAIAQQDFAVAREMLDKSLALEGYAYTLYALGLARVMSHQGEHQAALELIAKAARPDPADARIDLEPERVQSLLLTAEIHRAAGEDQKAKAAAKDFLHRFDQADPGHPARQLGLEIAGGADAEVALK
ncbi:MAG: tetratricopeptide repeat protein, partial [Xanthomonadales bacterium]|nr:tetratricopeptide repeat protein [Xanthomonadales bacterium]